MRKSNMTILGPLIALALASLNAAGAPPSISLQQALDQPIDALTVENVPIAEVFRKLSEKSGVKFVVDDQTMACLPYGDQTRLDVRMKNATIRKDLSRVLAPEALQWTIENDMVRIVPTEALARMCRRASYDELLTLGNFCSHKIASVPGSTMIEQLRKDANNKELDLAFQGTGGDKAAAIAQADRAVPCTGAEWLDRLCQQGPWTWYLWGDQIIVLDRKAQVARQLQQQVSLRYQNEKLITVLLDLARKGRLKLDLEPGVLNYVPSEIRTNFNLVMADASIDQTLQVISGATGLEFVNTEEGVRVGPSEKLLKGMGAETGARKTPFFVRMNMPGPGGTTLEVYFRPDELPEEMVQQIEAQKADVIERWMAGKPVSATTVPILPPK